MRPGCAGAGARCRRLPAWRRLQAGGWRRWCHALPARSCAASACSRTPCKRHRRRREEGASRQHAAAGRVAAGAGSQVPPASGGAAVRASRALHTTRPGPGCGSQGLGCRDGLRDLLPGSCPAGSHVHHRMSATQSSTCARSFSSSLPVRQAAMLHIQATYCMAITAAQGGGTSTLGAAATGPACV